MLNSRVTAILGPTNTGKTHDAIQRMMAHRTGVIGLPLRLLAREVYDRIVAIKGPGVVAMITGEERIVPPRAAYWVCTVEAMPEGLGCDFLAVDEIQLCNDPERGHVFTDRLLNARAATQVEVARSHPGHATAATRSFEDEYVRSSITCRDCRTNAGAAESYDDHIGFTRLV